MAEVPTVGVAAPCPRLQGRRSSASGLFNSSDAPYKYFDLYTCSFLERQTAKYKILDKYTARVLRSIKKATTRLPSSNNHSCDATLCPIHLQKDKKLQYKKKMHQPRTPGLRPPPSNSTIESPPQCLLAHRDPGAPCFPLEDAGVRRPFGSTAVQANLDCERR